MEDEDDPASGQNLNNINFQCNKCGFCCQLDVVLYPEDMVRINELDQTGYYRKRSGETLLKRKRGKCIFYDFNENNCTIYEHRPSVCRKFPFKKNNRISYKCKQKKDFKSKVSQSIIKFINEKELAKKEYL